MKNLHVYLALLWLFCTPLSGQTLVIPTSGDWQVAAEIGGDSNELKVEFINPKGEVTRQRDVSLSENARLIDGINSKSGYIILLTISDAAQGGYQLVSHLFSQIGEIYTSNKITHLESVPNTMKMLERIDGKLDIIWSDARCTIHPQHKNDSCKKEDLFAFSLIEISFYYPMMRSYFTRQ